jgi:hypothetical protein
MRDRGNRSAKRVDEQRPNDRLKVLTDELSKLRGENSRLQNDLAHERSQSPARHRPMSPLPPGDDPSILNYERPLEERNPVDRLLTEVSQKSELVRRVEEAKQGKAPASYIQKLESLLTRLDSLHSSLAQQVDGRLIAHIRAHSPPRCLQPSPVDNSCGCERHCVYCSAAA